VPLPVNNAGRPQPLGSASPASSQTPTATPPVQSAARPEPGGVESGYAWFRLMIAMLMSTIGGVGMWSVVVTLPVVQAEFGVDRAAAALPYTLAMVGFALGGLMMGRLSDRFGVMVPLVGGSLMLGLGYIASSFATSLWQLALAHMIPIAMLGCSATFSPLIADISQWFTRNRGIAMAIAACGNYLSATLSGPIVQYLVQSFGWRQTHVMIGLFCLATMLPLAMVFRRPPPLQESTAGDAGSAGRLADLGLSPQALQILLIIAGVACCVAMSMPQVHIVAYCADLGYGGARGAEMLSLMMGFGIISRLLSGWISDYIGGLRTLALGSLLQGVALLMYLPSDALMSLYVVSALFGLFQGGIIPSYALIVREFYPAREAGTRIALCVTATIAGMALGGWMSGIIYDQTGSYQAAFLNGIAWNALNLSIAGWMLWRVWGRGSSGRKEAMAA
jgi:MFS family permease